jgi:hypothetical protein
MVKIFYAIHLLFFLCPVILTSQDLQDNLNNEKLKNQVFIHGKLQVFPTGKFENGTELYLLINDSTGYFKAPFQSHGGFSFLTEKVGKKDIEIDLSVSSFGSRVEYYPIVIKNVILMHDTVNLGTIPVVIDTIGYWEEWGNTIKKNIFDRKKYFWTREVYDLESRLTVEKKLNNVYSSFCIGCNPIFVTEKQFSETKKNFTLSENRKIIIDYQEILALSEYFDFNFAHADSFALGFINFMKRLPDSNFADRFNKTVINYKFPKHFTPPDSIVVLSNNQLMGYDEDSIPTIYSPNCPELHSGLYRHFKSSILDVIELSLEEKTKIDNQLRFFMEVDKEGHIRKLKLLSLVNSQNRHLINNILEDFKHYKLLPTSSRGKSSGFKAALYIDL